MQTGLGRLGRCFAYLGQDFVPDVLVLAKALSGGIVPVSVHACLVIVIPTLPR